MSDQWALDKICWSLNSTQNCSARLPPPASPLLKDYWYRVPFYWLVHVNTCDLPSPEIQDIWACPVQRLSFENKMTAMSRKRANSSVDDRNLHMFSSLVLLSSVVLLLLQEEYIFHPQEIKNPRGFGINRCPLCFASGSWWAHIPLLKQWQALRGTGAGVEGASTPAPVPRRACLQTRRTAFANT